MGARKRIYQLKQEKKPKDHVFVLNNNVPTFS